MTPQQATTIALLGGNTVVGHALSLLLHGRNYDVRILESLPTGSSEVLLQGADVLLICPGLTKKQREESLAALRGSRGRMHVPVLELSSDIMEGLLDEETEVVPWPIKIGALTQVIEDALKVALQEVPAELGTAGEPPIEEEPVGYYHGRHRSQRPIRWTPR